MVSGGNGLLAVNEKLRRKSSNCIMTFCDSIAIFTQTIEFYSGELWAILDRSILK